VKLRIPRALLAPLLLLFPSQLLPQILLSSPATLAAQLLEGTLSATVTIHRHQPGDGMAGGVGGKDECFGSGSVAADVTRGGRKP
jgi:hypothetical protein